MGVLWAYSSSIDLFLGTSPMYFVYVCVWGGGGGGGGVMGVPLNYHGMTCATPINCRKVRTSLHIVYH